MSQEDAETKYLQTFDLLQVIDKGCFSEVFSFKSHSPPSGLNRKPRKNPLFSL